MSRAFLLYSIYKPEWFAYVGSAQFGPRGVGIGDTLWVCKIEKKRLYLTGRVQIAFMGDEVLVQEIHHVVPVYGAPTFAIADSERAEIGRRLDITSRVSDLRFVGENDRIPFNDDGTFGTMHFRSLRELMDATAQLFDRIWAMETENDG